MPYIIQPQQFQSSFVPRDLGVIQQSLAQHQQRYDATSTALAETKAKLYESLTYDPVQKKAMIDMIEGRFDDIYRNYSGDLGAAAGDVMDTIASSRAHPYFNLNKLALEKQKQQEALIQQYGPDALKFATLPQGLSVDGKWRPQADFTFDIEKKKDYATRVGAIWEQALEQVSRETKPVIGPDDRMRSMTEWGKGVFDQVKNKFVDVLEEYKSTSEYTQHKKVLMHPDMGGMTEGEAEQAIKDFVRQSGDTRTAPKSYKFDVSSAPAGRGATRSTMTSYLSPFKNTFQGTTESNMFESTDDIKDAVTGGEGLTKKLAENLLAEATSTDHLKFLDKFLQEQADKLGVTLTNEGGVMEYDNPFDEERFVRGVGFVKTGGLTLKKDMTTVEKARWFNFKNDVAEYNAKVEANLGEVLPQSQKMRYVTINPAKGETKKVRDDLDNQVTKLNGLITKYSSSDFTYLNGAYSDPSVLEDIQDKLKDPEKYIDDKQLRLFDGANFEYAGHNQKGEFFQMILNDKYGRQHTVIPNSFEAAVTLAEATKDPEAVRTAVTSTLKFVANNSDDYWVMRNGEFVSQPLAEGFTIGGDDDRFEINFDGRPITVNDRVRLMEGMDEPKEIIKEIINNYLISVSNAYETTDRAELGPKPALFREKGELYQTLSAIGALNN